MYVLKDLQKVAGCTQTDRRESMAMLSPRSSGQKILGKITTGKTGHDIRLSPDASALLGQLEGLQEGDPNFEIAVLLGISSAYKVGSPCKDT